MVEFLTKDLESRSAIIRLSDDTGSYRDTTISQATITNYQVVFERLNSEKKPKHFCLSTNEMNVLVDAWTVLQAELEAKDRAHEAYIAAQIKRAQNLVQALQFDLPELNIQLEREETETSEWTLKIPAFEEVNRYYIESEYLPHAVNAVLNKLSHAITLAERYSPQKQELITSYRKIFPRFPESVDPGTENYEIASQLAQTMVPEAVLWLLNQQAEWNTLANILKEDLLWRGYALSEGEPGDLTMTLNDAAGLVLPAGEYSTEQGEKLDYIAAARNLLEASGHPEGWRLEHMYPGTSVDCYSFDNGLKEEAHSIILNKPASELLNLISAYLVDRAHLDEKTLVPEPSLNNN
ncbi:MAG TPA: hypothetical protein VFN23_18485 [Ktedonobacteraceae bacterium]|nr:hypothetical protein [Ktedonobacteraceae bacterium]